MLIFFWYIHLRGTIYTQIDMLPTSYVFFEKTYKQPLSLISLSGVGLYFYCIPAAMQRPLLIWHCTRAIQWAFGQRPIIHTISYLIHVIKIRQSFTLVVET